MRQDFLQFLDQNNVVQQRMGKQRIQLSSIKPDIKEICKIVIQCHSTQKLWTSVIIVPKTLSLHVIAIIVLG